MIFNVKDFGAKCDGTVTTREIQSAIDACFKAGGGEVVIPQGVYIVAGIRLRSNVMLHLLSGAVLKGSIDPKDYFDYLNDEIEPITEEMKKSVVSTVSKECNLKVCRSVMPFSAWNNGIIRVYEADNFGIVGDEGSVIDGQNCFDPTGEEQYRGPHAINMWYCKNVVLSGYTIIDSANWAHAIQNSTNIKISGVTVLGGHDGFDVRTCNNVVIESCVFKTGDDCIAGFDNLNVAVNNCYFESGCSMLRFGGTNVTVDNCEGRSPVTYGFRGVLPMEERAARVSSFEHGKRECKNVLLYYCDYRAEIRNTPGNMVIKNSRFYGMNHIIDLPFGHIWCCNRSLHDVKFENCIFEDVCGTSVIEAPENEPLEIYFENCKISSKEEAKGKKAIDGANIYKLVYENTDVIGFVK